MGENRAQQDYARVLRANIRALRLQRRLSQKELGRLLHMSRCSIRAREKTGNIPSQELPLFAEALGVENPQDLLLKEFKLS